MWVRKQVIEFTYLLVAVLATRESTMEPTCAACAMEWSIQLEKGLRSGKPGHSLFFHISSEFLVYLSYVLTITMNTSGFRLVPYDMCQTPH